jgi:membrane dipeptidase
MLLFKFSLVSLKVFPIENFKNQVPIELNFEKNSNRTDIFPFLAISQRFPSDAIFSKTARAIHMSNFLKKAVQDSEGKFEFILTKSQLIQNKKKRLEYIQQKKQIDFTSGLFSIEGAHVLDGKLENVDVLFGAGVRMFGFSHFIDNEACGSAHGSEKHGLTLFGKQVLQRVKELKMVIDLAHVSKKSFFEILEIVQDVPVIVSHTGVQGTCPGTRNLDDDQIKAISKVKGVVGIAYFKNAICGDNLPRDIAKAIKYVRDLVGVDYVSLGSDFDGAGNSIH